jgi:hypothetical protein
MRTMHCGVMACWLLALPALGNGQLLYPPKPSDAPDRVLAVGAVAYGKHSDLSKTEFRTLVGAGREWNRHTRLLRRQEPDRRAQTSEGVPGEVVLPCRG